MNSNKIMKLINKEYKSEGEYGDLIDEFLAMFKNVKSHCIVKDLTALDAEIASGRQPSHVHLAKEMNNEVQDSLDELKRIL